MYSNLNYDVVFDRRLMVLRWKQVSTEALDTLVAQVVAHREQVGEPLFFIAIINSDAPPADEAARGAILDSMNQVYEHLYEVRLVPLGSGLRATLVRGGLTLMTLATGLAGRPFFVDKSIHEAANMVAKMPGYDAREVVDLLVTEGLLTAEEAGR